VGFYDKFSEAACKVKDWDEAIVKLNWLIYRRIQQLGRDKVKESINPVEPDDWINLKA